MSVELILNLGDDAHMNQWQLVFPTGLPTGGDTNAIALRIQGSLTLPEEIIYQYDVDFKGTIIKKTGRKEDTDKTLACTVRLDQQWEVYDNLRALLKAGYDSKTNTAMPDVSVRFPILLQFLDGTNAITETFTFTYCKLTNLKVADPDQSSGDPMTLDLTFIYGDWEVE